MKTLPSVALGTWSWGTGFAGEAGRVFAEAANDSPEVTTGAEDKLTAELLGKRVAKLVLRFN